MSPVILDVESFELDNVEREKLAHPAVGGLILFSRNYAEPAQLSALVKDIRATVKRPFLVSVDHEGGRVQRFREGFSEIPAMQDIELAYPQQHDLQNGLAHSMGYVMAHELIAHDIDLSFAPVLDLNGVSDVIGSRAFSAMTDEVIRLGSHYATGMACAGMKACGKHFPGHGSVKEDSHINLPVDKRMFDEIDKVDMQVFRQLIANNKLDAIMPAHVIYSEVDEKPAGFSHRWIKQILRETLGFSGVVFSDDLTMEAASVAGNICDRADMALSAGCTMILVCNKPEQAEKVLDHLPSEHYFQEGKSAHWHQLLLPRNKMPALITTKDSYEQALRVINKAKVVLA
ncbi:beta-N-acetylhexosaminidase [Glaciecola sp. MH2013]|nr:beta-N-acetylhexosaminidase [Glaciecola sp. MH2013]